MNPYPQIVDVQVDLLAEAKTEVAEALSALRQVESELAVEFAALAEKPAGYAQARDTLDSLDRQRRQHLERLGELAARFLVLRSPSTDLADPVEPTLLAASPQDPPSSVESPPSPAPVSERQLEEFKVAFSAPSSSRAIPRIDDRTLLLALANHVSVAEEVSTVGALDAEVEQLERAASEERQKRWREMTREGQVRWLSLLVAWARALEQDAVRLHEPTFAVTRAFKALRAFSMNDTPGFVHGFARNAEPRAGTWRAGAVGMFREIRPEPGQAPRAAAAKPKVATPTADENEECPEQDPLAGWRYAERVRGLRVALLGGEAREERRVALERAFQFASLEWIPRDRPRLVASLAERAARGTVDIVLVTKFVAHNETEAVARSTRAPLLTMRHGYGVTTVRQVLEEHFARLDGSPAAAGE